MSALANLNTVLFSKENEEVGIEARKSVIELVAAKTIAFLLPMPSEAVEDIKIYFIDKFMTEVRRKISAFNEEMPINIHSTYDLVFTIYRTRYNLVYTPFLIDPTSLLAFLSTSTTFSDFIEPKYKDLPPLTVSAMAQNMIVAYLSDK